MRSHQQPSASTKTAKDEVDDLVYFRFGKNGADEHQKVRAISGARGCTMASVIRGLIKRGLADLEMEQAILAAHKSAGATSAMAAGG